MTQTPRPKLDPSELAAAVDVLRRASGVPAGDVPPPAVPTPPPSDQAPVQKKLTFKEQMAADALLVKAREDKLRALFEPDITRLKNIAIDGDKKDSQALAEARQAFLKSLEGSESSKDVFYYVELDNDDMFLREMKSSLDKFTAAIRASEKNPRLSAVIESLKSVVNAIFKCLQNFCKARGLFKDAAWLKQDHLIEPSAQTKVRQAVSEVEVVVSSLFSKQATPSASEPEEKPSDAPGSTHR